MECNNDDGRLWNSRTSSRSSSNYENEWPPHEWPQVTLHSSPPSGPSLLPTGQLEIFVAEQEDWIGQWLNSIPEVGHRRPYDDSSSSICSSDNLSSSCSCDRCSLPRNYEEISTVYPVISSSSENSINGNVWEIEHDPWLIGTDSETESELERDVSDGYYHDPTWVRSSSDSSSESEADTSTDRLDATTQTNMN